MLYGQPPRITHQGGYGMPGRQRLFKKLSPDAASGANDQDIHGLLLA
jgi:hypothetical protein